MKYITRKWITRSEIIVLNSSKFEMGTYPIEWCRLLRYVAVSVMTSLFFYLQNITLFTQSLKQTTENGLVMKHREIHVI